MTAPRNTTLQRVVRVGRAIVFGAILLLIHRHHDRWTANLSARQQWSDQLKWIRQSQPDAAEVTAFSDDSTAARVLDRNGKTVGVVLKTLPAAGHVVGFSGPTDVGLLLDPFNRVSAVRILSSGDTVEHVRAIENDAAFLTSLQGQSVEALRRGADIDAVSGATLTSLAMLEGIRIRLREFSRSQPDNEAQTHDTESATISLRFPNPPMLSAVQRLYPDAAATVRDADSEMIWIVRDSQGNTLGHLLRTSPAADNLQGLQYQGPTSSLIAFGSDGTIIGIAIGTSYENEPYIDYVRDDEYFCSVFNGLSLNELAELDPEAAGIEGVSGATMSSRFIAESVVVAAQARLLEIGVRSKTVTEAQPANDELRDADATIAAAGNGWRIRLRDISTTLIVVFGAVLATSRLRGRRWLRVTFQLVLIVWLGLVNGDMVSQALLLGWTRNGVPWRSAFGLAFLTAAALLVPVLTGRNVYCSHMCPHGALQQLLMNRFRWRARISRRWQRMLRWIPSALLIWVAGIGLFHLAFSAVDIEPFDAWVFSIAGAATIAIAVTGLVASLFVPMAYCRFGCPTGALLEYVSGRGSDTRTVVSLRDGIAVALLLGAVAVNVLAG